MDAFVLHWRRGFFPWFSIFGFGLDSANLYSRVSLGLRGGNFLPAVESYRVKAPIGAGRL
jgi:hypothetical protein